MKLTRKQKIVLWITGAVFLRWEKRPGWSASMPIYAIKCSIHGLIETYPQGREAELRCGNCLADAIKRSKLACLEESINS